VSISEVPFNGPIGGVALGYINGQYIINPTVAQCKETEMFCTIASTGQKVVMIEAEGNEIPDEIMFEGIKEAHNAIQPVIELINQMVSEVGLPKFPVEQAAFNDALYEKIVDKYLDDVRHSMDTDDKNIREERYNAVVDDMIKELIEDYPEIQAQLEEITYKLQKAVVKEWLLNGKRVD
jgi:polyribonucleotide nucleotidyltransferase